MISLALRNSGSLEIGTTCSTGSGVAVSVTNSTHRTVTVTGVSIDGLPVHYARAYECDDLFDDDPIDDDPFGNDPLDDGGFGPDESQSVVLSPGDSAYLAIDTTEFGLCQIDVAPDGESSVTIDYSDGGSEREATLDLGLLGDTLPEC